MIKWVDANGKQEFKLGQKISSKWRDIGYQIDMTQNELDGLGKQKGQDSDECWTAVMGKWLQGQGSSDYPVTWEGLYTLLDDIGVSEITAGLKKAVICAKLS